MRSGDWCSASLGSKTAMARTWASAARPSSTAARSASRPSGVGAKAAPIVRTPPAGGAYSCGVTATGHGASGPTRRAQRRLSVIERLARLRTRAGIDGADHDGRAGGAAHGGTELDRAPVERVRVVADEHWVRHAAALLDVDMPPRRWGLRRGGT